MNFQVHPNYSINRIARIWSDNVWTIIMHQTHINAFVLFRVTFDKWHHTMNRARWQFLANAIYRCRHASRSRHVRYARAEMHVGIDILWEAELIEHHGLVDKMISLYQKPDKSCVLDKQLNCYQRPARPPERLLCYSLYKMADVPHTSSLYTTPPGISDQLFQKIWQNR